jgi:hypothetical protein
VSSAQKFTVIAGSERKPVTSARLIGNSPGNQTIEVSIRLRPKSGAKHGEMKSALEKPDFEQMSRADFEKTHGAEPVDLERIKKFAQEFNLKVHETGNELARRTVLLSGTVSNLQKRSTWNSKSTAIPKEISAAALAPSVCLPNMRTSSQECSDSTIARRQNRITGACRILRA